MSFDITNILSKFSRTQRILALVLLLVASVTIALGPTLIKSLAPDNTLLHKQIKIQRREIDSLSVELFNQSQTIIQLNKSIILNQQECTNAMSQREAEIVTILKQAKTALQPPVHHESMQIENGNDELRLMMTSSAQPDNKDALQILDKAIKQVKQH